MATLQAKMQEYLDNGARFGWLINRQTRQVEIYSRDWLVDVLDNPDSLSGEDILPGFILQMFGIW